MTAKPINPANTYFLDIYLKQEILNLFLNIYKFVPIRMFVFILFLILSNICNCSKQSNIIMRIELQIHFEELPEFLKIKLARAMIARFCQKVKDTPNQDRITPSNHASNKMLAVTRTIAPAITPTAVEVFID